MPETKKLLVAFDPTKPDAQSSDFLVPWHKEGRPMFLGLKTGEDHTHGMLVWVGRAISENELFAKLVDSGVFIANVNDTLICLRDYVAQLQDLKIGNVVRAVAAGDGICHGVRMEMVAKTPSGVKT